MNTTNKLLDKYQKACALRTDMAAAEKLALGRSALSAWRHGHRHAEADAVAKMCDAIGEPLAAWLPLIESERSRTPAAAKAWLRLARAAAGFAAVYLLIAHGADAHAMTAFVVAPCIHYAQLLRWP